MSRTIAGRSLLAALAVFATAAATDVAAPLLGAEAEAARRGTPRPRTVERIFRLDIVGVRRHAFRDTITDATNPDMPPREIEDSRRFEWSASSGDVRVTALGRTGRWRNVALKGGARFSGRVDAYDSTLHTVSPFQADPPRGPWSTCTTDLVTKLEGRSTIEGLGASPRAPRGRPPRVGAVADRAPAVGVPQRPRAGRPRQRFPSQRRAPPRRAPRGPAALRALR